MVGGDELVHLLECRVHGRDVAPDDLAALAGVRFLDGRLDGRERTLDGQDSSKREEAGLHHGIDVPSELVFSGDPIGVDHENSEIPLADYTLSFA
jgi:hypothetical protein